MTVSTTQSRVVLSGNGSVTVFPFSFLIPASGDELIIYTDSSGNETTLTSSQYTVTGFGNATGGTVTYPLSGSPIASGTTLTIARNLPYVQGTSLANQGPFLPSSIEAALDYNIMAIQQIVDLNARSISVPVTDSTSENTTLPAASARAGTLLAFADSTGAITTSNAGSLDTVNNLQTALNTASASASAASSSASAASSSASAAAASAASLPNGPSTGSGNIPMWNGSSWSGVPASTDFRNRIINGTMERDQRNSGASGSTANGYTIDRWGILSALGSSKGLWGQNLNGVTSAVGFPSYLGFQSSSAYSVTSSDYFTFYQYIEAANIEDFAWGTANAQTVTLSFRVYSSLTGTFGGSISNYSATRSYPFSYIVSAANTWTTISVTVPGDTGGTWVMSGNGGSLEVRFGLGSGSTYVGAAGAWAAGNYIQPTGTVSVVGTSSATFYVTGVQLEVGSVATPFERRPIGVETTLCQRYFQKLGGSANYDFGVYGYAPAASASIVVPVPITPMRASPTATVVGSWASTNLNALNVNTGATSITLQAVAAATGVCGSLTTGSSTYLTLSAEL